MNDIKFLYPMNGLLVLVVLLIIGLVIRGNKKKSLIAEHFFLSYNHWFRRVQLIGLLLGLISLIIGLMGPVQLEAIEEIEVEGLDIYVLVDTSKSMLVEDVLPSRIERAKDIIGDLLDNLEGNRIGFIPYASSAYIQMPLTDDYKLGHMFLDVIDTDMMSGGGSNVSVALDLAIDAFDESSKGDKVILILSDGEQPNKENLSKVTEVKDESIKIYSVGIGTTEGGLIPQYNGDSSERIGYKKDEQGKAVISKLDESLLKSLSEETKGKYYLMGENTNEGKTLIQEFEGLEQSMLGKREVKHYNHIYQYFLGVSLCLLVFVFGMKERGISHE